MRVVDGKTRMWLQRCKKIVVENTKLFRDNESLKLATVATRKVFLNKSKFRNA